MPPSIPPSPNPHHWRFNLEEEDEKNLKVSFTPAATSVRGKPMPEKVSECSTVGFSRTMAKMKPQATGLLPPLVRWISPSGLYVLMERPPHRRVISFCPKSAYQVTREETTQYEIAVPWSVYAVGLSNRDRSIPTAISLMFANHQIQTLQDELFLPPLPNLHTGEGRFCLPPVRTAKRDLASALLAAVEVIWNSGFNLDMYECMDRSIHTGRPHLFYTSADAARDRTEIFRKWSTLSLEEVVSIRDWPMSAYSGDQGYTVGDLIKQFNSYDESSTNANSLQVALRKATASSIIRAKRSARKAV